MKIIYTTRATATGGRSGRAQLDDGSLGFDLAMPGSGKAGANPEQLFAIVDTAVAIAIEGQQRVVATGGADGINTPVSI